MFSLRVVCFRPRRAASTRTTAKRLMKHAQGIVLLLLRRAQGTLQAPDYFDLVENQGHQFLEMLGSQVLLKEPLDQWRQGGGTTSGWAD